MGRVHLLAPFETRDINERRRIAVKLKRYVLGCYAIWVVFLIALYYALPGLHVVTWGLISLSGVIAIVAGTVLNHPSRKAPWLVLAAAQASFAAGQLSFLIAQR